MGVVGGSKDLAGGRRRFVQEALKDLSPALRESVIGIIESWEGGPSEDKLAGLMGRERAKHFIKSFGER